MRSLTFSPALWALILGTAFPILGCDTPTTSPSVSKPDFAANVPDRRAARLGADARAVSVSHRSHSCLGNVPGAPDRRRESELWFPLHPPPNDKQSHGGRPDDGRHVSLQWPADKHGERLHRSGFHRGIHAPQHQPFRRTWSGFRYLLSHSAPRHIRSGDRRGQSRSQQGRGALPLGSIKRT